MSKIELLSPAGDYDSLVAAVRTGADAVYLGLSDFNARRNAVNFDIDSFSSCAAYLRRNGVKAYITLNTLIRDDEMPRAVKLATQAALAGADGFIIQDIGLADMIKSVLPEMEIHASTQCAANSPSAIPFLANHGFCRTVVAREMSCEQMSQMCREGKKYNVEIESFVHGALCVSLSGQCYLSAAIGTRSANRGMCAGACRLPFGINSPDEYALSLKDLSLIDSIPQMIDIGVASLKIEGRMKDAEYVAAATAACRAAIDGEGRNEKLNGLLKDIFSRGGFTNRYFTGVGDSMQGVRLASDKKVSDSAKTEIHELYRKERSRIPLDCKLTVLKNTPAKLELSDGANEVAAVGKMPEIAKTRPIDKSYALGKISKTGDTPYFINNFELTADNNLTLSGSALGELRRTAVSLLDKKREELLPVKVENAEYKEQKRQTNLPQKLYIRVENVSQLPDNIDADGIIIPAGEECPKTDIEVAAELSRRLLPESELEKRLDKCISQGIKKIVCNNIASVEIVKRKGLLPIYGPFMNVFNSYSLQSAKKDGAKSAILSFELSLANMQTIDNCLPKGIISYGYLPLMLMAVCPRDGKSGCKSDGCGMKLCDRTGTEFSVLCRDGARELLNSRPVWMADRTEELLGIDVQILYFTEETKSEVEDIVKKYKINAAPTGEFTRGLYYRAVK